ncbi:MAG: ATP-binding cassette domain-containing protein [Butyrivibrio sp.]|nr:ATP-binding cassette domain-containing protein [Butyrivibrio sp.]
MEDIIRVSHLKKHFGDIKAVDDISFVVKKGELFGFLGLNGAGKSTTINILCTLLKQNDGDIEVCGFDAIKEGEEIRKRIGVVFQENTLDNFLTVRENLELRGSLYEKDRKKVSNKLEEVANLLGIDDILSRQLWMLSGGKKRCCEIAKSLMNTPEVLFLDEPTTGLDPQTRNNVWECIEKLRTEKNLTVFLTTHYMEEAARAGYLCIMDSGKIVASDTPSKLKMKYATDVLKLYSRNIADLAKESEQLGLSYKRLSNAVAIDLAHTKEAFEIVSRFKTDFDSLEVVQGNMDDVFINVTGKKIGA